jgi:MoxR-like ATPase
MAGRLSCAFKEKEYFDYLMLKFSTPEEIFGPIDIKELKEGNYIRKTEKYLPTADFAFLDEIWKSNPAILNTLLTIINEKKFRNGNEMFDVPLKGLIGASNETPPKNEGLEALWDRFVVRLEILPL